MLSVFKYYTSSKNIVSKDYNRSNANQILKEKISNLPVLKNDTNNVINFNSGYENNNENYKRSFWDLFKK